MEIKIKKTTTTEEVVNVEFPAYFNSGKNVFAKIESELVVIEAYFLGKCAYISVFDFEGKAESIIENYANSTKEAYDKAFAAAMEIITRK